MSAATPSQALQRVVVRMLFDPAFVLAVYGDPAAATAGLGLSEAQRAWLVKPDRRAWTIDRERRSRALAALIEEYAATTQLLGPLDGFFSSQRFHDCVQARGVLAFAYGRHAVEVAAGGPYAAAVAALVALESALAGLRRGRAALLAPGQVALHYRFTTVTVPAGTSVLYAAVAAGQGPTPLGDGEERLLAELKADGSVDLGEVSYELATLAEVARSPGPRVVLEAEARRLGCDEVEAVELIDDLARDGLLTMG